MTLLYFPDDPMYLTGIKMIISYHDKNEIFKDPDFALVLNFNQGSQESLLVVKATL